ncbi:MAG: Omp28 family outer membrane lipoprotein [Bacteroides sp.]|nr:Omp28 family outer membrane lipoprotein [Bacteroides sp.]
MKASYFTLGLMLLAGITAGCDNISEDDRYIKEEKPEVENPRTLLIMEFTGNRCINCPDGAQTIEKIKEDEAPRKVISVGLHPEGDANTRPIGTQNFQTEAATALYQYYDPSGFPTAIFNGLNMSGSIQNWMQRASEALLMTAKMTIDATTDYDPSTRKLTVDYDVAFTANVEHKLNVTVWLVENKIIGSQYMSDGKVNRQYEHNHVLRASLNGNWGENLGAAFYVDDHKTGSASMTLDEGWAAENCEAVVYVYRDDNKEVEQAISVAIGD